MRQERSGFFSGLRRRRKGGYNHVSKMKAVERDKMQRRRQPTVYRYSSQEHDTGTSSESRPESFRGDSLKSSKSSSFRDKVVPNVAVVVSEPDAPPAGPEVALLHPESSQETIKRQKELAKGSCKPVTTLQDVYRESAIRDGLYSTKNGETGGKGCLDQLLENEEPDEFGPFTANTAIQNGATNTMLDIEEETSLSNDKTSDEVVSPNCQSHGKGASRLSQRQSPNLSRRRFSHEPRLIKQSDSHFKRPGNRGRTLSVDEIHRSTPMLSAQGHRNLESPTDLAECRTTASAENLYPNLSHYLPVYDGDHHRQSSRGSDKDSCNESPMRHAFSDQSIQQRKRTECPPKTSETFSHRISFGGGKKSPDVQMKLLGNRRSFPISRGRSTQGPKRASTPDGSRSKVWNDDSLAGLVHNRGVPLKALSSIKSSDV